MSNTVTHEISMLRREFTKGGLRHEDLHHDPIEQFKKWFNQALEANIHDTNAMTLSTVKAGGLPDARIVLLKGIDKRGFIFYTNYNGQKAVDIEHNPHVALCFYWSGLDRQVRIGGTAKKISRKESAEYFASRPRESQIGAWASDQSSVAETRTELESRFEKMQKKFEDKEIPLPDFWGGYVVQPSRIEFWQGRPNRLHDRFVYEKAELKKTDWGIKRLYP